jgi:ABC-type Fe3+ transport system permease subunit
MSNFNQAAERSLPAGAFKWNWGAFLMSWIWGLGNRTYIALLCLIPVVNLVMIFVLGANGSKWAWKNGKWESTETFNRIQGLWTSFGLGLWAGIAVTIIIVAALTVILFTNVFL